jgi:hypothetical protein
VRAPSSRRTASRPSAASGSRTRRERRVHRCGSEGARRLPEGRSRSSHLRQRLLRGALGRCHSAPARTPSLAEVRGDVLPAPQARVRNDRLYTPGARPPSTSGLGRHPFKVVARVRIPLGACRTVPYSVPDRSHVASVASTLQSARIRSCSLRRSSRLSRLEIQRSHRASTPDVKPRVPRSLRSPFDSPAYAESRGGRRPAMDRPTLPCRSPRARSQPILYTNARGGSQ